ncbi:hypothetical protein [Winogradskyella vincentii]|uniref:Uncharacterized protein n=1 Tax=Winogradskyella vincentii TaxID=2877122 RepID=A0ABS7Y0C7_9FLAO|nr:hypothetical protein [Winogradskyella vincentii]MCA0153322.1 hypothetical protein [Winogradskyella vincentii]
MLKDIPLKSKDSITKNLLVLKICTWHQLIEHVKNLPYGRNSNRSDFNLVITENKGTCSSKHALLKKVADVNGLSNVKLILGIYKMNQKNTPKIGSVLSQNNIDYIPEAHCYLNIDGRRLDYTSANSKFDKIAKDILEEIEISPEQVVEFKINYHKNFIKGWLEESKSNKTFTQIWDIREKCITHLSGNS